MRALGSWGTTCHGSHVGGGCFPDDSRRCSQVKLGSAADFLLDISETDLSTLTASIKAPSGRDEPCLLKRLPNNHIGEARLHSDVGIPSVLSCPEKWEWGMVNLLGHTCDGSPSVFLGCKVDHLPGYSGLLESQGGSRISLFPSQFLCIIRFLPILKPRSVPGCRHLLHPPGSGRTLGQHQEERQPRGQQPRVHHGGAVRDR